MTPSNSQSSSQWLDEISWTDDGLVPVIAQDSASGKVLMLAWMNRESLQLSVNEGRAIYWSRSRKKLWRKGEESGHVQVIKDIRLDCDNDVVLIAIEQVGGIACHTGRERCFYKQLQGGGTDEASWVEVEPVVKDPSTIYKK